MSKEWEEYVIKSEDIDIVQSFLEEALGNAYGWKASSRNEHGNGDEEGQKIYHAWVRILIGIPEESDVSDE